MKPFDLFLLFCGAFLLYAGIVAPADSKEKSASAGLLIIMGIFLIGVFSYRIS